MPQHLKSAIMLMLLIFTASIRASAEQLVNVKETADGVQTRAGEAAGWKDVDKEASVKTGHTVKTGAGAKAVLTWFDGYALRMDPLTMLEIETVEAMGETRKTSLKMSSGRLVARAPKLKTKDSTFTIQTPAAVTGVRGTAFEVLITEDNQTIVTCIEDAVFVASEAAEVILDPGFTTTVLPDTPPAEPAPAPQEQIDLLKKEVESIAPAEDDAGADSGDSAPADSEDTADKAAEQAHENVQGIIQQVIDDAVDQSTQDSMEDHHYPY